MKLFENTKANTKRFLNSFIPYSIQNFQCIFTRDNRMLHPS